MFLNGSVFQAQILKLVSTVTLERGGIQPDCTTLDTPAQIGQILEVTLDKMEWGKWHHKKI